MKVLQALKPQFLHIFARLSVNRCREYTRKTMKNSFLFSKFISLGKTTFIKARGFSSDNKNVLYTWRRGSGRKLFNYEQEFSNFISSLSLYMFSECACCRNRFNLLTTFITFLFFRFFIFPSAPLL